MEINQTQERTVYAVTAEQNGWIANASVAVVDGKVQNIDGSAYKDNESVTFNCYRNGDKFMRTIHNVTDGTVEVYGVVESFVTAIKEKYEGE